MLVLLSVVLVVLVYGTLCCVRGCVNVDVEVSDVVLC